MNQEGSSTPYPPTKVGPKPKPILGDCLASGECSQHKSRDGAGDPTSNKHNMFKHTSIMRPLSQMARDTYNERAGHFYFCLLATHRKRYPGGRVLAPSPPELGREP